MNRNALLLALMGLFLFPLAGCPADDDDDSASDDDDATGDDDDATGDDDDATGDDDDATGDDDDATGDDDDSSGDDDDSAGDDDDSAGDDDDSAGDDDDSAGDDDDSAGDDDDSAAAGIPQLPVFGVWDDTSGFHAVTDHAWLMHSQWGTSRYDLTAADAGAGWLVAQNAATNSYYPNLWSKFEWFEDNGQLYYCQSTFDAASESAAENAASADPSNINGGCGGFGWSTLDTTTAAVEPMGVHVDSYGTEHTVTDATWTQVSSFGTGIFAISQFDTSADWAVAQNDASNSFNPNLWSRFDWTWVGDDLYVCQTAFDAADEAAALNTAPADANDLATGCGTFPWSHLTP